MEMHVAQIHKTQLVTKTDNSCSKMVRRFSKNQRGSEFGWVGVTKT